MNRGKEERFRTSDWGKNKGLPSFDGSPIRSEIPLPAIAVAAPTTTESATTTTVSAAAT